MDGGAWKERGTGSLHLNVDKKDKSARLGQSSRSADKSPTLISFCHANPSVMRAEGVFRLILNAPLYAGMKVELTDRYVKFAIVEEGKIRNIAIRVRHSRFPVAAFRHADRHLEQRHGIWMRLLDYTTLCNVTFQLRRKRNRHRRRPHRSGRKPFRAGSISTNILPRSE